MEQRLEDKVAFITGVGAVGPGWGNGRATAVLFAREGATVFGVDIDLEAAEATQGTIKEEGGACAVHRCDVTRSDEVAAAVVACVERFGRIDILFNNVGGSVMGGPVEIGDADWDAQLTLNLKTAYLTLKHVLPVMARQGGGAIVNLASIAGLRYLGQQQAGYEAAKAGLIQLTRSVALGHARSGIRCNAICPGFLVTPAIDRIARDMGNGDVDSLVADLSRHVPLGRLGNAWDVAHAALYLASEEASYVTGTDLVVDGGLVAGCVGPLGD
jgi:hypothetical protein